MVIAVDFDGTIVEHRYPEIGEERPFAVETLKKLAEHRHKLVLWTMREGQLLDDALEWCKACLQKRIDQDHLEDVVDWDDLIVKEEKIDEHGWYRMECRLPLKELF